MQKNGWKDNEKCLRIERTENYGMTHSKIEADNRKHKEDRKELIRNGNRRGRTPKFRKNKSCTFVIS
jgi:hypothetical protein